MTSSNGSSRTRKAAVAEPAAPDLAVTLPAQRVPDGEPETEEQAAPPDAAPSPPLESFVGAAFVALVFGLMFGSQALEWYRSAGPGMQVAAVAGAVLAMVAAVVAIRYFAKKRGWQVGLLALNVVGLVFVAALVVVPALLVTGTDRVIAFKILAIGVLALLPGALYVQFLAVRGQTLWEEYLTNLGRLDVSRYGRLPADANDKGNLYLRRFEAVYGRVEQRDGQVVTGLRRETLAPVLVLTLLCAVGWIAVLQPEVVGTVAVFDGGIEPNGRPVLGGDALRYGFLGAYFWIAQSLVRRYFQDDLRADAYVSAILRIVTVLLLVSALDLVLQDSQSAATRSVVAFGIGVFPQVALLAISALVGRVLRVAVRSRTRYPLGEIDGLDIWYEARLIEEGIEDVENLAHADLISLLLNTRIPVDRLVDWIDQAHLLLRLPPPDEVGRSEGRPTDRTVLQQHGIRSATGLEDAFRAPSSGLANDGKAFTDRLAWILNDDDGTRPSRTIALLRTLGNEPNLHHVRAWRAGMTGPAVLPA